MKVYKGTDMNMCCRGKQYTLGETVVEENADLCKAGLHACEMPIDVLGYYAPSGSRYFMAEAEDVSDQRENDSKIVAKKMTLKAEIGKSGVALAAGISCKAKGRIGCAICCIERGKWNGETFPIVAVKAAIVDGEKIKADTWYRLENGEFVEVK